MTNEQKAFAILVNCLIALGLDSRNERFRDDLDRASELMGISLKDRMDVLRENRSDP